MSLYLNESFKETEVIELVIIQK